MQCLVYLSVSYKRTILAEYCIFSQKNPCQICPVNFLKKLV